VKPAINKT